MENTLLQGVAVTLSSPLSLLAYFLPSPLLSYSPYPHAMSHSHLLAISFHFLLSFGQLQNGREKAPSCMREKTLNRGWMGSKKVAPWGKHSFVVFRDVVRAFCAVNSAHSPSYKQERSCCSWVIAGRCSWLCLEAALGIDTWTQVGLSFCAATL